MSFILGQNYIPYSVDDNLHVLTTPNAIKKITGNTIDWNQLSPTPDQFALNSGATRTYDAITKTATITATTVGHNAIGLYIRLENSLVASHRYLLTCSVKPSKAVYFALTIPGTYWAPEVTSTTTFTTISSIGNLSSASTAITLYAEANRSGWAVNDSYEIKDIFIIDLTQLFYSGNEPTTTTDPRIFWAINYAKTHPEIVVSKLINVEISAIESIGFNKWDEEWEVGSITWDTGANATASDRIRSKNYIKAVPNITYHLTCVAPCNVFYYDKNKSFVGNDFVGVGGSFTTPANCDTLRFATYNTYGNVYNHDICINISDSSKDGIYEPYNKQILNFPAVKLMKAENICDDLTITGKLTSRVGTLNLSERILSIIDTLTFRSTTNSYELGKDAAQWGTAVDMLSGKGKTSNTQGKLDNATISHKFISTDIGTVWSNQTGFRFSLFWISLPSTYNTKQSYVDFFTNNTVIINFELSEYTENYIGISAGDLNESSTYDFFTLETFPSYDDSAKMILKPTAIIGNSFLWNQWVQNPQFESSSGWYASSSTTLSIANGIATISKVSATSNAEIYRTLSKLVIAGHKYLAIVRVKTPATLVRVVIDHDNWSGSFGSSSSITSNQWAVLTMILTANNSSSSSNNIHIYPLPDTGDSAQAQIDYCYLIDLGTEDISLLTAKTPWITQYAISHPDYTTNILLDNKLIDIYSRESTLKDIPLNMIGVVDASTLDWGKASYNENEKYFTTSGIANLIRKPGATSETATWVTNSEGYRNRSSDASGGDSYCIAVQPSGNMLIHNSSYNSLTATEFKSRVAGLLIYYERMRAAAIDQRVIDKFMHSRYHILNTVLRSARNAHDRALPDGRIIRNVVAPELNQISISSFSYEDSSSSIHPGYSVIYVRNDSIPLNILPAYPAGGAIAANLICDKFHTVPRNGTNSLFSNNADNVAIQPPSGTSTSYYVLFSRYGSFTKEELYNYVINSKINWELSVPQETSFANLYNYFDIQSDGSIEGIYENNHPVPSTVEYDLIECKSNIELGAGYTIESESEIPIDIDFKLRIQRQ